MKRGAPDEKCSMMKENTSGLIRLQGVSSSFCTLTKSGPKKTELMPWMPMSLTARGEASAAFKERNSCVPPEERTGVPGMNWSELGLGVVWVWTNNGRRAEEERKASARR